MIRRSRFAELVERQLDLFEREQAELLDECATLERAFAAATRESSEERYGQLSECLEDATEALEELRDFYAASLEEQAAREYRRAFARAARRRLPQLSPAQDDH